MADWSSNTNVRSPYGSASVSVNSGYSSVTVAEYCGDTILALIGVSVAFGLFVSTILVYCCFKCCCPRTLKRTRPGVILGSRSDVPVIVPVNVSTSVPVRTEVINADPRASAIFPGPETDNDRASLLPPPALELTTSHLV